MINGTNRILTIIILIIGISTGCSGNKTVESQLSRAEQVMQSLPDSALRIIENIDTDDISRRSTRARYPLLYSQALDKNYIDQTNDSLIRIAGKYYRSQGNIRAQVLTGYYHSRILCNNGDYTRALLLLLRLEDKAQELNDPYLLGMLYHQISEIYTTRYDYPNKLKFAQQAYDSYLSAGLKNHCGYALFDIGEAYFNLEDYDNAFENYKKSLYIAIEEQDSVMQRSCLSNIAMACVGQREPENAIAALWQIKQQLHEDWDDQEYISMANAYLIANRLDSAQYYLNMAEIRHDDDPIAIARLKSAAARIHIRTRELTKAATEFQYCLSAQDSLFRIALQESYASLHRDYLDKRQRVAHRMLLIMRQRIWLASALFITIILFVGFIAFVNFRKRQLTVAKYMSAIEDINNAKKILMVKLDSQQQSDTTELRRIIKDRYSVIDQLASTYYERQGMDEQKAIYNKVKNLLDSYASDEKGKQEIERIVNLCYDNVMQKVREELPTLKDWERDLLCYVYAGFSLRVISVFTGDSINYVAVKKSRLKTKIAESDAPSKDFFISLI